MHHMSYKNRNIQLQKSRKNSIIFIRIPNQFSYISTDSNAEERMGKKISGITNTNKNGYSIFWIDSFSDELKSIIKNRLSAICHGIDQASTDRKMYCYKKTLEEFVKRFANLFIPLYSGLYSYIYENKVEEE